MGFRPVVERIEGIKKCSQVVYGLLRVVVAGRTGVVVGVGAGPEHLDAIASNEVIIPDGPILISSQDSIGSDVEIAISHEIVVVA